MRSFAIRCACLLGLAMGTISLVAAKAPARHMALVRSEPAADSTVSVAPTTLRLYWTQSPKLDLTQIRLATAANQQVTLGAPKISTANQLILDVPVTGQVAPGVYTVTWRTAGDDGHVMNGSYKFTYRADR